MRIRKNPECMTKYKKNLSIMAMGLGRNMNLLVQQIHLLEYFAYLPELHLNLAEHDKALIFG
jgi:hypothetical protein